MTSRLFGHPNQHFRSSTPAPGHDRRNITSPGVSHIAATEALREEEENESGLDYTEGLHAHGTAPSAPPAEFTDEEDSNASHAQMASAGKELRDTVRVPDITLEKHRQRTDMEITHLRNMAEAALKGVSRVQDSVTEVAKAATSAEVARDADNIWLAERMEAMDSKAEQRTQQLIQAFNTDFKQVSAMLKHAITKMGRLERQVVEKPADNDDSSSESSDDQTTVIQHTHAFRGADQIPRVTRHRAETLPISVLRSDPSAPKKRRDSAAAAINLETAIEIPVSRETKEKEAGRKEAIASLVASTGSDRQTGLAEPILAPAHVSAAPEATVITPAAVSATTSLGPAAPATAPVLAITAQVLEGNGNQAARMDSLENFSRFKFLSRQLPSFSGRPDEGYDQYEAVILRFVQQHRLSDTDALIVLKESLVRGSAAYNWLAMEEHKAVLRQQVDRPFADVMKAMREKYGVKPEDREHLAKDMKMTVFETADDYVDRKMIAMMQAGVTSKIICIRALQNGILSRYRSEVARMSALIEEKETLDKAADMLKVVLRGEMKRQQEGLEHQVTLVGATAPLPAAPQTSPPVTQSTLDKAMAQLRAAIGRNNQSRQSAQVEGEGFAPRTMHISGQQCYNCQATDHFIKECPYPNPRQRRSGPPQWKRNSGNGNPGDGSATSFRQ